MEKITVFIKNLFVPHEANNYRAKSLHTDFLGLYLLFAVILSFAFKQGNFTNVLGLATDITIEKLYELTNQEREKNGLPALSYNDKLSQAAKSKAQDMFSENYWAHYSPSGKTPWDFIANAGYRYEYAGENLAKNFLFSDGVVSAWMASLSHRENILKKDYREVGYAIVNGTLNGEETTLVVQMFGKPAANLIKESESIPETTLPEKIELTDQKNKKLTADTSASVLSRETRKTSLLNGFNLNAVFMTFLIAAIIFDLYFASKSGIIRIGGKNIAHFLFLIFMFVGLFIISRGAII